MAKKKTIETHTAKTKYASGNFYGSGIRNPVGKKAPDPLEASPSKKKLGKPPKSTA